MSALLVLLTLPVAYLPPLLAAGVIWWIDCYEREPLWAILLALGWGAFGATVLGCLVNTSVAVAVGALAGSSAGETAAAVVSAPLFEEAAKGLLLLALLAVPRLLDNVVDGIVYAAMVALGFAMTENLLYILPQAIAGEPIAWASMVVVRTLLPAPMHVLATGILGAALGWACGRGRRPAEVLGAVVLGYGGAVLVHFVWNSLSVLSAATSGVSLVPAVLMLGSGCLALFLLGIAGIFADRATLRRELSEEAVLGVLPMEHLEALTHVMARRHLGRLLPPAIAPGYLRTAVRLAFTKAHARHAPTEARLREVQELRLALQHLLT